MRITFTAYGNIQTATGDGAIATFEYEAGTTATVPDDVAVLFINSGVAEPAKASKAKATAGETADL